MSVRQSRAMHFCTRHRVTIGTPGRPPSAIVCKLNHSSNCVRLICSASFKSLSVSLFDIVRKASLQIHDLCQGWAYYVSVFASARLSCPQLVEWTSLDLQIMYASRKMTKEYDVCCTSIEICMMSVFFVLNTCIIKTTMTHLCVSGNTILPTRPVAQFADNFIRQDINKVVNFKNFILILRNN